MKWIRREVLSGKLVTGTFLNLGSHVTAEVASQAGFDWVIVDLEHGAGDRQELLRQLQAVESGSAVPIVRLGWNETPDFKRTLDLGASGIMVPFVNTAEEARHAASALQYPPDGERGCAVFCRATAYGAESEKYFAEANANLLSVVQIETTDALQNAAAIAAIDRVDVLFVGPNDLSISMGIPRRFEEPEFRKALSDVVVACRQHGKAAGILAANPQSAAKFVELGFTFVAAGSDGAVVAAGLQSLATGLNAMKS